MHRLLTIDEAQSRILERVRPLGAQRVALAAAQRRVLARAAVAAADLPPFPSSAMDGFAVRAADTPGVLRVVGESAAGRPAERPVGVGESIAIATGAVVPDGADAVVPVEYVVSGDNNCIEVPVAPAGNHIRPRGGDARAGDEVVPPGVRLGAAQLGALAAAGVGEVTVARRPNVAILSTGSELRPAGSTLGPGEIYDANAVLLAAAAASAGAAVETLAPVVDEPEEHRRALERGLEADVLLTSGGVSVGPHDLVRREERALGVQEVFWGVAVKPGKPISFGVRDSTLVFGLPGNPVSTLVGFELFVRPALLALQGSRSPLPEFLPGTLAVPLRRDGARDVLVRARTRPAAAGLELQPVTGQESHMIVRAAAADALVLVERGDGEVRPGTTVRFLSLGCG